MSIDKLGSAASIIAALRAEMTQRNERGGRKAATRSEADPPARAVRDVQVLRKQLAEIVKAVDVRDEAAVHAVRPQVVRAILLWEFGAELREHPDWQPMLNSITRTLESQPAHQLQFSKLIGELKR
ncbi:hypothetical protein [Arenimonas sp.]|uniref:hypothetical protein n=1 Tax=Arenimonas sp. TaxID=1872635 RepID=UPI0039E2DEE0